MKTKRWTIKQLSLLIALMLLVTVSIGGSLAYIFTKTDGLTNTFKPTEVTCEINETMNNNVKSEVSVVNTGGTDAYIRVAIVATWQKMEDGAEVVSATPAVAGTDYSVEFKENTKWVKSGDYWYYKVPVAPNGGVTDVLIESCTPLKANPDGFTLHVEIIADAIQSNPVQAVTEAWGVDPSSLQ